MERNYRPLSNLDSGRHSALLYLGASADRWHRIPKDFLRQFDRLAFSGSRVVIAFRPVTRAATSTAPKPTSGDRAAGRGDESESPGQGTGEGKEDPDATPGEGKEDKSGKLRPKTDNSFTSVAQHWGAGVGTVKKPEMEHDAVAIPAEGLGASLPAVSWHSLLYFKELSPQWDILYEVRGRPVLIRRSLGLGSIILAGDAYFFSNEALQSERHPQLLAWLVGNHSLAIFEESHFGVVKSSGVASLVHKYRLQWFFVGIVVLFLLFAWHSAVPFLPDPGGAAENADYDYASEKDSTLGLISLLRRNVPSNRVLAASVNEWKQASEITRRFPPEKIRRIESIVQNNTAEDTDPVTLYRKIHHILNEEVKG